MHRPRQSNLLAPRSLTPSRHPQEHSPTTSTRSKKKLDSIVNMYCKNDYTSNYDRGREILEQNYNLMGRLRNISDSKHKDSVHEKMRPSPQFVNSYCKYIRDIPNKKSDFTSHNLSFEDRKHRYLEKMKRNSKPKVIGTPSMIKKTIILPDISQPSTISVCPLDGNSEKTSINSRGYGNFSHYVRSEDRDDITDRNTSPLLQNIPEYKKAKPSPNRSRSTRKSDNEIYYEQKKYIFFVRNLKIREKMFFIELSQQKEKQEDLFIFARDLKTTHLYTLRLKYSAAERILELINYNYNELINHLEFRNSKIILTLDDPVCSPHHTSKIDLLTKVLEEKKSEEQEYNEDFESLTSFERERKNEGHKQSQSFLADQISEF